MISIKDALPAVHAGNYYGAGTIRVIEKMKAVGIDFTESITVTPPKKANEFYGFSPLQHALMDYFEGRDYNQAQRLIHYSAAETSRSNVDDWYAVYCDDGGVLNIADCSLAKTELDAVAAIIETCDQQSVLISKCEYVDGHLVFLAGGKEVARVEKIQFEPFSLDIRNRVRTTLKGVRTLGDHIAKASRIKRLPGFDSATFIQDAIEIAQNNEPRGCFFLGFPNNWALAMKESLSTLGIGVKLSQAQELTAVFFGANSWYQLVMRVDEPICTVPCVVSDLSEGTPKRLFYRTTEEAIFSCGQQIKSCKKEVVISAVELSFGDYLAIIWATAPEQVEQIFIEAIIECGSNDILDEVSSSATQMAAEDFLRAVKEQRNPIPILRDGNDIEASFFSAQARNGILKSDIVRIGNYYLCFKSFNSNGYLQIQQILNNECICIHQGLALYKADFIYNKTLNVLVVFEDYRRNLVVSIPFVSPLIIKQIEATSDKHYQIIVRTSSLDYME